ncbi:MAG TPA: ABC transporter substrate-binding protein, partial [Thermodesulfobacteriota bacterium]|nr:ABC transporter substrate-binding protein [Thermodesulfobacteriota bacterium]
MRKKTLVILVAGIAVFLGLSLEGFAQQKAIKMGVTAALQKEAGIGVKNAAEMAAEEINAKGGILGNKIELYFADDDGIAEKGVTAI